MRASFESDSDINNERERQLQKHSQQRISTDDSLFWSHSHPPSLIGDHWSEKILFGAIDAISALEQTAWVLLLSQLGFSPLFLDGDQTIHEADYMGIHDISIQFSVFGLVRPVGDVLLFSTQTTDHHSVHTAPQMRAEPSLRSRLVPKPDVQTDQLHICIWLPSPRSSIAPKLRPINPSVPTIRRGENGYVNLIWPTGVHSRLPSPVNSANINAKETEELCISITLSGQRICPLLYRFQRFAPDQEAKNLRYPDRDDLKSGFFVSLVVFVQLRPSTSTTGNRQAIMVPLQILCVVGFGGISGTPVAFGN
jgi:hypothetical protein